MRVHLAFQSLELALPESHFQLFCFLHILFPAFKAGNAFHQQRDKHIDDTHADIGPDKTGFIKRILQEGKIFISPEEGEEKSPVNRIKEKIISVSRMLSCAGAGNLFSSSQPPIRK